MDLLQHALQLACVFVCIGMCIRVYWCVFVAKGKKTQQMDQWKQTKYGQEIRKCALTHTSCIHLLGGVMPGGRASDLGNLTKPVWQMVREEVRIRAVQSYNFTSDGSVDKMNLILGNDVGNYHDCRHPSVL